MQNQSPNIQQSSVQSQALAIENYERVIAQRAIYEERVQDLSDNHSIEELFDMYNQDLSEHYKILYKEHYKILYKDAISKKTLIELYRRTNRSLEYPDYGLRRFP
jgi:hypothetical protein